ncbi:MAG: LabA-like NYN domain-containing protein [Alphaproteobacteria bacterium]
MKTLRTIGDAPFYSTEKLAIFIDGANLYAAARALEFDIDYRLLLDWAAMRGRIVRAFYYTAVADDQEYSPLRPLVDWLDYNGYKMVTKPAREFTDLQGRKRTKGNMDIELAIDMMEIAPHVDHIMLFSGDGDFRRLIEAVQRQGVRVTVVSTIKSATPMVADDLRRQADHFLDLDILAPEIMRDQSDKVAVNEEEEEEDDIYDDRFPSKTSFKYSGSSKLS